MKHPQHRSGPSISRAHGRRPSPSIVEAIEGRDDFAGRYADRRVQVYRFVDDAPGAEELLLDHLRQPPHIRLLSVGCVQLDDIRHGSARNSSRAIAGAG